MLKDSSVLEEVQLREALVKGLNEHKSPESTSAENQSNDPKIKSNILRPTFSQWIQQPISIAATVLVAVGILFNLPEQNQTSLIAIPMTNFNPPPEVRLNYLRGNEDSITTISSNPPILLDIDLGLGPVSDGTFNVSIIEDQSGEVIVFLEDVEVVQEGLIRILLYGEFSGDYQVITSSAEHEITRPHLVRFTD